MDRKILVLLLAVCATIVCVKEPKKQLPITTNAVWK